ncbi:MAG: hypothetical protein ACLR0N_08965 [Bilophila wadsworthia]
MTLNILWWVAFFVFGLALQQALPGTDVLVAGLFLALQERRPFQLAVVLLALILVQEGVGTLDFGTSVLWYLLVITLFFIGRWMFETENWLFVLLLSGCIGLAHYGVIWLMTRLQFIPSTRRSCSTKAFSGAADAVCLAMQHDGAPVGGPQ